MSKELNAMVELEFMARGDSDFYRDIHGMWLEERSALWKSESVVTGG
jgi:hypothetical protein